ncbi:MAG TPA: hypothetical protein VMR17_02020 [Xanthobacteraceae bacterium]|jgi:hypothetical protein|nr:hypothetical protein [Xanthobacteraceae bacterium]
MTPQHGLLAVFHECRAGREAEFEAWYQGEHLVERLAVPGFLYGRRLRGVAGTTGYCAFYLVETPAVLTSKAYLERLDNPTPMTRKMMAEVFANMNRTICIRAARRGTFRGAFTAIARFNQRQDDAALSAAFEKLATGMAVAGGEIWTAVDAAGMPASMEEKLRGGDNRIAGALTIETLYQEDAERIGTELAKQFPSADVGIFRALCDIGRGDL